MTKSNLGQKSLFQLTALTQVALHHQGKSTQGLKAVNKAETTEHHCALASSSCLVQPCFLYHPGTSCPGVTMSTVDWALLPQSLIKKMTYTLFAGQSEGGIVSIKIPTWIHWGLCQVDKNQPAQIQMINNYMQNVCLWAASKPWNILSSWSDWHFRKRQKANASENVR